LPCRDDRELDVAASRGGDVVVGGVTARGDVVSALLGTM
jgi:hypothetical protein